MEERREFSKVLKKRLRSFLSFFFVDNRTYRTIDVERPCRNSTGVEWWRERFDVLVGHWLCRVEVKVRFLHSRQCEVHVHAATRSAGSYEPSFSSPLLPFGYQSEGISILRSLDDDDEILWRSKLVTATIFLFFLSFFSSFAGVGTRDR